MNMEPSKLIDREQISSVIDDIGTDVDVFLPFPTVDSSGNMVTNYLTTPIKEKALIRPRTDTTILNEQGQQSEGDALGYFKFNSSIKAEAEIHVQRDEKSLGEANEIVYFVISVQSSYFENELKFMKAIMQKRRY